MSGYLLRICRRSNKPPLPSILLANVHSLDNKIEELHGRWNYQRDIKNEHLILHGVVAERRQHQHTAGWLYDVLAG